MHSLARPQTKASVLLTTYIHLWLCDQLNFNYYCCRRRCPCCSCSCCCCDWVIYLCFGCLEIRPTVACMCWKAIKIMLERIFMIEPHCITFCKLEHHYVSSMCVCVCMHAYVHANICVHVYVWMYVCMYCLYMHLCVHVCVYIDIWIYVYVIYILYIYIFTHYIHINWHIDEI